MNAQWLDVLVSTAQHGEPPDGIGPILFQTTNDLHIATTLESVEFLSIHKRRDEPVIAVSLHFDEHGPDLAECIDVLGEPRRLPRAPDAPVVEMLWKAPLNWCLPEESEVLALTNRDARVTRITITRPWQA
jgi:hypothetical protein